MLDIVPANENKLTAAVDGAGFDHRDPRLAAARGMAAQARGAEAPDQPGAGADEAEYNNEGDEEPHSEGRLRAKQAFEHERPRTAIRLQATGTGQMS
ncbi:MAG: hypothetical protein GHHEDOFH_03535 [Pseudorhodoplanes sp.]|nr:hypothetical protein [Pseudorhodoplanes sp.]